MNNHERTGAPHAKRAMAGWASRLFVLTILATLAGVFEAQGLVVGPFDVVGSYDGFFLASQTFSMDSQAEEVCALGPVRKAQF